MMYVVCDETYKGFDREDEVRIKLNRVLNIEGRDIKLFSAVGAPSTSLYQSEDIFESLEYESTNPDTFAQESQETTTHLKNDKQSLMSLF